ncbi:hypothetical protein STRTUCAR8_07912, partial [Streptomyces turgidiscabies Car8]
MSTAASRPPCPSSSDERVGQAAPSGRG